MRIDAHQHFWQYEPVRDSWIGEDMSAIRRDFMPEDLWPVLQENGIDGCITVQSDQSEAENVFQLKNAKAHAFIKGVVGWVDFRSPALKENLEELSRHHKLKGFRHVLQGEAQRDLMLEPFFTQGIGLLAKHRFTYDLLIFPDQLAFVAELAGRFPDQPFVLDHIAKPRIKEGLIDPWCEDIKALARCPNVYCKLSGLVTEADWLHWRPEDFRPYLDLVVDAFGTDRILFGSDWPVCLVAASYSNMRSILDDYFKDFSADEQRKFWGQNAQTFYNL